MCSIRSLYSSIPLAAYPGCTISPGEAHNVIRELLLWDRRSPTPKARGCLTRQHVNENASSSSSIESYESVA